MSCAYLLMGGSEGPFKVGWVITRAGTHLVGCLGRSAQQGSPQPFRSNFGPIQEGDCATFLAVSDTRCSTYMIFTAFLTAECSTVELPGSCATPLFSFYYSKQIHAMTIRNDVQNALAPSQQASSSSCDSCVALSSESVGLLGT
jgi:hypothetical protein